MQDTLKLPRTARKDPTKSAYEALQGPFDYNKTPMAVLGTKALAFIDPEDRAAWQAHGVDAFVAGRCPLHYRLLEFFNPKTRAYLKTGTYKLYPRHSKVPSISKADRTLLVAQEMLTKLQIATSKQATEKMQHNQALRKLTKILQQGKLPQRVGANQTAARSPCAPQRVQAPQQQSHPQRVDAKYSTMIDPTNPEKVRATRYVH